MKKPYYQNSALKGFSRIETVDQFDSFVPTGMPNPFSWHIAFFRNCLSFFRQILALFSPVG